MRRPKTIAARVLSLLTVGVTVVLAGFLSAGTASAHGEDKQPPSLRTGTVQFYNVEFSKRNVSVGEDFTIKGEFYVSRQWAEAVADPTTAQLTVVEPGPVALVTDRRIGGEFLPESMKLAKGKTYSFEIDLVARRVGTWHMHPQIMVQGAGPLIGPGVDITIEPSAAGGDAVPANYVTLQNGERVDLETYNQGTVVVWHLLYIVPAVLFLVYWLAKPLVPRMARLQSGRSTPESLLTKRDIKVTVATAGVIFSVMVAGMVYSSVTWPDQIPLQVKRTATPVGTEAGNVVSVRSVASGRFTARQDELEFTVRFDNTGDERLELESFTTAGYMFDDRSASTDGTMRMSSPVTLAPGEQEEVTVTLVSKQWEDDELIPSEETNNRIGGLFMFSRPGDGVEIGEVSVPVIHE